MSPTSLADELIADRRFEQYRENTQDAFTAMSSKPRLRRVAAHAYISVTGIWNLTQTQAARPMSISISEYVAWQSREHSHVGVDEFKKISCLLRIYKYLMTLYSGNVERVSTCLSRLNRGAVFDGQPATSCLFVQAQKSFIWPDAT